MQLTAALCLIEEQKGRHLHLKSIQNAKFLQEIRPGSEILIQCIDCLVKGLPGSRIQIYSGDKIAASLLMIFSE
jgi:3-hydroxymyristoyl/3-hydroxydecanoyl-(acyl carrier protein) dehydratase